MKNEISDTDRLEFIFSYPAQILDAQTVDSKLMWRIVNGPGDAGPPQWFASGRAALDNQMRAPRIPLPPPVGPRVISLDDPLDSARLDYWLTHPTIMFDVRAGAGRLAGSAGDGLEWRVYDVRSDTGRDRKSFPDARQALDAEIASPTTPSSAAPPQNPGRMDAERRGH